MQKKEEILDNEDTCFRAIEEDDEINSNSNHRKLQEDFEELYVDIEKLNLKNASFKKKKKNPMS